MHPDKKILNCFSFRMHTIGRCAKSYYRILIIYLCCHYNALLWSCVFLEDFFSIAVDCWWLRRRCEAKPTGVLPAIPPLSKIGP